MLYYIQFVHCSLYFLKEQRPRGSSEIRQIPNQPAVFRTIVCFCSDRTTSTTWATRTRDPSKISKDEAQHDASKTAGPANHVNLDAMLVPQRRSELPPLREIPNIPPVRMSEDRITPRFEALLGSQISPDARTSAAPPKLPPIIPRASW